ncbi:MAG: hypothetical protein AAB839_00695 [Patescibacteria group bacterium]
MFTDFSFAQLLAVDALVTGGVIVGSFLFTYTLGKHALVPALTALGIGATFAALAAYPGHFPLISGWPTYQQNIVVFAIVSVFAFCIFRRHAYFEPTIVPTGVELAVCAVMTSGFILAILGAFLPADVVSTISPNIRVLFVDPFPRTLWLIVPVAVLTVMRGK